LVKKNLWRSNALVALTTCYRTDNYKAIWQCVDENLWRIKTSWPLVKPLHLAKQSGYERQLGRFGAAITQR